MAASTPQKTVGDFVAIAIGPALIMTLIGSLVFFLVEVLYRGQYSERLHHVFGCFIFAAVLVARIGMYNPVAAGGYGTILAISAWICLNVFVEYPKGNALAAFAWLINIGLLGLIFW